MTCAGLAPQVGSHPQGLADGEDADRHHDDVDAVRELREADGEPLLAGDEVDADDADGQADEQGGEAADPGGAEHGA